MPLAVVIRTSFIPTTSQNRHGRAAPSETIWARCWERCSRLRLHTQGRLVGLRNLRGRLKRRAQQPRHYRSINFAYACQVHVVHCGLEDSDFAEPLPDKPGTPTFLLVGRLSAVRPFWCSPVSPKASPS